MSKKTIIFMAILLAFGMIISSIHYAFADDYVDVIMCFSYEYPDGSFTHINWGTFEIYDITATGQEENLIRFTVLGYHCINAEVNRYLTTGIRHIGCRQDEPAYITYSNEPFEDGAVFDIVYQACVYPPKAYIPITR